MYGGRGFFALSLQLGRSWAYMAGVYRRWEYSRSRAAVQTDEGELGAAAVVMAAFFRRSVSVEGPKHCLPPRASAPPGCGVDGQF